MRAKKRFGQNFLTDETVLDALVAAIAIRPDQHLFEIGPGQGALTQAVLPKCRSLTLIEIDHDLVKQLQRSLPSHCQLIVGDACTIPLPAWSTPRRLIGNLPYNVATPIILRYLKEPHISDLHVMVQKEVGQRITATPGSRHYGRLSIICRYFAEAELITVIPPTAFTPAPKVDSAFIRLTKRPYPLTISSLTDFEQVVKKSFSQRRKMLKSIWKELPDDAWSAASIVPTWRAEACEIDHFIRLTEWITNKE